MKPIIINIEDITDSTEVYDSKPGSFMVWFIYIILGLLALALIWMNFFSIDIVVKADGIFKYDKEITDISSSVSGKIKSCSAEEGQFIKKGDKLLVIDDGEIRGKLKEYEEKLSDVSMRIEILEAYKKWLDGDSSILTGLKKNKYYAEFNNRKKLLNSNNKYSDKSIENQKKECKKNISNLLETKDKYEEQVYKLKKAEKCVKKRENTFAKNDLYYISMVDSYISNYKFSVLQYNNKIDSYKTQLKDLQEKKQNINDKALLKENEKEIKQIKDNIKSLKKEMKNGLMDMELQQISNIEQQIENVNSSLYSVNSSIASAKIQLKSFDGNDTNFENKTSVMTEKNNVSSELNTYIEQKKELKNNIDILGVQAGKYVVRADATGYISMVTDIKSGTYIQEGTSICQILPEKDCGYYAEVYISNSDIAKVEERQNVKFAIPAYPPSEYGYFTGKINMISKDIKADSNTGNAYYMIKIKCDKNSIMDKDGNEGKLINGMACQAKVVTGKKSVLKYILDKIDI